jgi:hypothetical protein
VAEDSASENEDYQPPVNPASSLSHKYAVCRPLGRPNEAHIYELAQCEAAEEAENSKSSLHGTAEDSADVFIPWQGDQARPKRDLAPTISKEHSGIEPSTKAMRASSEHPSSPASDN